MTTRMLVWSDYCTTTGFSNVMSNILRRLPAGEFEIDVVGVNYQGNPDYDHERFPGRVWPALSDVRPPYNDHLGRQKFLDLAGKNPYDVIFMLQDLNVACDVIPKLMEVKKRFARWWKTVYYFPVDCAVRKNWVTDSASLVDIPVAYTLYGADTCMLADKSLTTMRVIPHGIDFNDFFVAKEEAEAYRAYWWAETKGKFLISNINRNQPRKDIPRTLLVMHELKKHRDDIMLYLHMSNKDIGGDLRPIAHHLGLVEGKDYIMPKRMTHEGVSISELNLIYNMSDAVITTTLGEGWGLSLTEAMATKTPVVAPNHTSITEILGKGQRGLLVKAGNISSMWTTIYGEPGILRPLTDVEDMAGKLFMLADKYYRHNLLVENAYDWVRSELDWEDIVLEQWWNLLRA